ncbi:PAS domain S-box protein [Xanthocytophaga agilis]|uniref:PAS domain S-box protein n=1 Tax=Xanthocytophaga agilis TaxID=3048010 RepID=A0AAE3RB65_9BACT|nr:PAS domain S-box protein [Xanthocytophaga agilis]MDJ1506645.1 PAS domain S-box protein [Xanthocytophaga agilis]
MFTIIKSNQLKRLYSASEQLTVAQSQISNALRFIKAIQEGNLTLAYPGLKDDKTDFPQQADSLACSLMQMREQMKAIALQENQRKWASEGLAYFTDILRDQQNNASLYDILLASLVKYIGANQGSLFVVDIEQNRPAQFLRQVACYAYDRKKYTEQTIQIGEGLVGQCYLEAESIHLTDIPANYISITSGLGDANPRSLVLIPFKLNEQVLAIVELASFNLFYSYQIEFIEKLGESIASSISSNRVHQQTQQLLLQSQQQTEELKAQQEELKQNLEELAASQEEVRRREIESQNLLLAFQTVTNTFASIEFDMQGNILEANENFLLAMGYRSEEIRGKHHRIFVDPLYAQSADYIQFWQNLQNGNVFMGQVVRYSKDQQSIWMQVSYAPVKDRDGKYTKVIKLANDITRQKELEIFSQQQVEELRAQEEELRQNMEELVSTQEEIERQSKQLHALSAAVNSTLATIEFDRNGYVISANDNFLHLMGYTLSQIQGKHHRILVNPDYRQTKEYTQFWEELRQGVAQVGEVERITYAGECMLLNASYTPVFDLENTVVRIIKFAQKVTAFSSQS